MESVADEQLMLAFGKGDARAFEELVRGHRTAVFYFLWKLSGQRTIAEDLLQETWLKVVRGAGSYEVKAKFTTWLYTIARNLFLDSLRKENIRQVESWETGAGQNRQNPEIQKRSWKETLPAQGASPERTAHNVALRPHLERALQNLPAEQREVFLLREYQGVQFKEIADITRVSENTVKSRMRYALLGLQRFLAEAGIDGDMAEEPFEQCVR